MSTPILDTKRPGKVWQTQVLLLTRNDMVVEESLYDSRPRGYSIRHMQERFTKLFTI